MTLKEMWKESLLRIILTIAGITLTIFPILYVLKGEWNYALIEGIGGVAMWLALFRVNLTHDYVIPAVTGWLGVNLVIVSILFNGGFAGTGLIWWSLLPITSFVLFGDKDGTKWVSVGFTSLVVVTTLNYFGVIKTFFSTAALIQTLLMIVVVSAIIYYWEKIAGESREGAVNDAYLLEEQVILKREAENELMENLKTLEKDKEHQLKVRSAMINLLEDSQDLEKQLKTEKENVEHKVEERTLELSNTKAQLDSSIENLPLGFLMVNFEQTLVVANSLTNKTLGGIDGKTNLEIIKQLLKDKINLDEYIKNCADEKSSSVFEDIDLKGRIYRFLISPILTHDQNISCLGIVILIQDTTETKILERSKDEFFSIASHELRTPLTAIRGNTSMILEYYSKSLGDPELKSMIDDIHESSVRLINIVNDFLNVSRLEQSRMKFNVSNFSLDELIPGTIKEYDAAASKKNVNLEYQTPSTSIPPVKADKDRVKEVLINLIGNALKFTDKGSIIINTEPMDKFVKVSVTDTGRGIPLKQQSLLFHKFQQTGESLFTRDTSGGSGLGLYISKLMIEGMGGELKLESSEEDKGSVFSFTLPLA